MPRFFIDSPVKQNSAENFTFLIDGENGRHIARSLRMKVGDKLTLCDGNGTDYQCEIQSFNGDIVTAALLFSEPNRTEPETKIRLYQSFPKGDKLESIVQKATELGITAVTPVESRRCILKFTDKNAEKKRLRLQKIAHEAAKQSGRGIVPQVHAPLSFPKAIEEAAAFGDILFFYELGGVPLSDVLPQTTNRISVFVGPEGGYSEEETQLAIESGAKICTLGRRILRTETAPLAALSVILFAKGEMCL